MKIYKIDRKKWLRGNVQDSTLWNAKIKKGCCVGLALAQDGVTLKDLSGITEVGDLEKVNTEDSIFLLKDGNEKKATWDLYSINDEDSIDDKQREKDLNKTAKKLGFQFEFHGKEE